MNPIRRISRRSQPLRTLPPRTFLYTYVRMYICIYTPTRIHISYARYFCMSTQMCEITHVSALAKAHFEAVCKQAHTFKHISILSCMKPCCADSSMFVPFRMLTLWTFLYTSKYLEVCIYRIIHSIVYEPMLCQLRYVCALASTHTQNLPAYNSQAYKIHIADTFVYEPQGVQTHICLCPCECSHFEPPYRCKR